MHDTEGLPCTGTGSSTNGGLLNMSRQERTFPPALTRGLAFGTVLFFLPLLLLVLPQVGQAAGWQITNLRGRAISQFAAAPAEGLVLYYAATSTNGLQRSSISTTANAPGFELWHEADAGLPAHSFWEVPTVRHLAVNPNNGRELLVLLTNDGQSSLHYSNDGGATWRLVRGNLDQARASAIALTPDRSLVVADGNRLLWRAVDDAGWSETVAWPAAAGLAGSILAAGTTHGTTTARVTPPILVVTTTGSLLMLDSINSTNWRTLPVGPANRVDLIVPSPDGMYAATDRGIYSSADGGTSWFHRGNLPGDARVQAMAVDPSAAGVLYVAVAGGGVLTSQDGGATWTVLGRGLETQHVHALVVDPRRPPQLLVATDDGVWRHALNVDE